jgi:arabinofuranosyltransferase
MNVEKKKDWIRTSLLFFAVFAVLVTGLFLASVIRAKEYKNYSLTLSRFSSDFTEKEERKALYAEQVYKKERFVAYGVYARIPPGLYRSTFYMGSNSSQPAVLEVQVAAERGKEVLFRERQEVGDFPSRRAVVFKNSEDREIEPRLRFISGAEDLNLEKVILERTKGLIPWMSIIFRAFWGAVLATVLILSVLHTLKPSGKWKTFLALFFFLAGFSLILQQAWISEDAFITLRHVDNFISGYGPVFNPGERVEGYSHPLWFAILSLFRWLGLSAKGSAVLPGLLFSLAALYLFFFKIRYSGFSNGDLGLNPAAVVLIGVSAFIDFGTSGLETALSYFLLVLLAMFLIEEKWKTKPLCMGLIVSALVLTRPDFGVFLLFLIPFYIYEFLKRRMTWKEPLFFLTFPALILGLHEFFRLGYYAALFPNPFYTKSGSSSYFVQGWRYLMDFGRGSLVLAIAVLAILALLVSRRQSGLKNRFVVLAAGVLYGFFVIRGGGDFMHGRFLLPAFLLISLWVGGAFDHYFEKSALLKNVMIASCLILFAISLSVQPIQKRGVEISHGISNERHYFYKDKIIPLKYLFQDTMIIMWKTMGQNYRWLSEEAKLPVRLAQTNVGFLGFYSGKHIYLIDRLGLTDPVVSRTEPEKRTRPGHEKHAPLGYLILRKLTFGETPFSLWNEAAATNFGVLWDLSPGTLKKLRPFIDIDVKKSIDEKISGYLVQFDKNDLKAEANFLFFLKEIWYPFASAENKTLFEEHYDDEFVSRHSSSYQWIDKNRTKVENLLDHIREPLSVRRFLKNTAFALGRGRKIKF